MATDNESLLSKKDRRWQQCQEIIKDARCESLAKAQLLGPNLGWGGLTNPDRPDNLRAIIQNIGDIRKIVMGPKTSPHRLLELDATIARALIEIITKQELFSNFDRSDRIEA